MTQTCNKSETKRKRNTKAQSQLREKNERGRKETTNQPSPRKQKRKKGGRQRGWRGFRFHSHLRERQIKHWDVHEEKSKKKKRSRVREKEETMSIN
jgi:hypothetical protein